MDREPMSSARLLVMLIAYAATITLLGFALAARDYLDVSYLLAAN